MTDRLNKESWLRHGVKTLREKGFSALKAEPMAKSLNVSRGSFYWHFKDITVFRQELLGFWQNQATLQVISDVNKLEESSERLGKLMQRAFKSDLRLERSVRAWANQDRTAAGVIATVDQDRLRYIVGLLIASGVAEEQANRRAMFLYWAYLGQMATGLADQGAFTESAIEEIAEILSR